jgi:hypothetical protein
VLFLTGTGSNGRDYETGQDASPKESPCLSFEHQNRNGDFMHACGSKQTHIHIKHFIIVTTNAERKAEEENNIFFLIHLGEADSKK